MHKGKFVHCTLSFDLCFIKAEELKQKGEFILVQLFMNGHKYIYRLQHWGPKIWEHFFGLNLKLKRKFQILKSLKQKKIGVKRISNIVILIMCPICTLKKIFVLFYYICSRLHLYFSWSKLTISDMNRKLISSNGNVWNKILLKANFLRYQPQIWNTTCLYS